jgi:hypothetical protein
MSAVRIDAIVQPKAPVYFSIRMLQLREVFHDLQDNQRKQYQVKNKFNGK